jgi:MOSC domain-containing protein YiiM
MPFLPIEIPIEVVAVSRSLPAWHDVDGVRTFTSIIHTPSDSIDLTTDGVVGNKTAVHDGPVYVFFAHHYDYWTSKLSIDRSSWDWSHWGENITVRCSPILNEHEMRLGDVWMVGNEVTLQVCGSRVPCHKLSWRLGQSPKWLKELADSGFCGAYMRVLAGGTIQPGDRAKIVERRPDKVSCVCNILPSFHSLGCNIVYYSALANLSELVGVHLEAGIR